MYSIHYTIVTGIFLVIGLEEQEYVVCQSMCSTYAPLQYKEREKEGVQKGYLITDHLAKGREKISPAGRRLLLGGRDEWVEPWNGDGVEPWSTGDRKYSGICCGPSVVRDVCPRSFSPLHGFLSPVVVAWCIACKEHSFLHGTIDMASHRSTPNPLFV